MTTSTLGKWYIHINQHKIRSNIRAEEPEPPIAIRKGKSGKSKYASSVAIPDGSRIIYSPGAPLLSCGARLVIECPTEPLES